MSSQGLSAKATAMRYQFNRVPFASSYEVTNRDAQAEQRGKPLERPWNGERVARRRPDPERKVASWWSAAMVEW